MIQKTFRLTLQDSWIAELKVKIKLEFSQINPEKLHSEYFFS